MSAQYLLEFQPSNLLALSGIGLFSSNGCDSLSFHFLPGVRKREHWVVQNCWDYKLLIFSISLSLEFFHLDVGLSQSYYNDNISIAQPINGNSISVFMTLNETIFHSLNFHGSGRNSFLNSILWSLDSPTYTTHGLSHLSWLTKHINVHRQLDYGT